jgi:MYXO-CTERM domain-containing protein
MNLLSPASNLNSIIILIGVSSVLFYFFFSIEHSGPGRIVARTGIVFLMIAFGAAFGYTVMARMSLLIGRLTDLIEFSDASYGHPSWWLLVLTIAALFVLRRRSATVPSQQG